jgi:protein TonB
VFISPEEKPEFPGGDAALLNFLSQNIKYPAIAAENGVRGKVTVNFVVNKDGSISDAKILRAVDPALDKEALRVVYSMPRWKPGKQGGKPVRVSFSVPINFVLQ